MKLLDILIILVFAFFLYKLLESNIFKELDAEEHFSPNLDDDDDKYFDILFDKASKNIKRNKKAVQITCDDDKVKPYFVENQFHSDYRDTINAFNNVAPVQKQVFNKSIKPVKVEEANINEVKKLVKDFIKSVNLSVKNDVADFINPNSGWDDAMPEYKKKSGWEKQQEKLGLPSNMYSDSCKKAKLKLIKIDHLEKYTTDDQTRYVTYLIVQKVNADDQLVLRVSFVIETSDVNVDRDFFEKGHTDNSHALEVTIEEIFVIGFMTDHSYGAKSTREDLYHFEDIEGKDGMMDPQKILHELNEKNKRRTIENRGLTTTFDDKGNPVHHDLSNLFDGSIMNNNKDKLAMKRLKRKVPFPYY